MAIYAKNKRANLDYDISDVYTAGLVLAGNEVKSVRAGQVSLTGSSVSVSPHGARLLQCHINPYVHSLNKNYEPTRPRALLLNKREISTLIGKGGGTHLIPLEIFSGNHNFIKLKFGVGRIRKKADKREYIKKKEISKVTRKYVAR